MNNYLAVTLGVLCAGIGGELFVRGAVDLGRWLRVPAALIGATSAASSPELAVALTAASAGTPEISLGDALGSVSTAVTTRARCSVEIVRTT